MNLQQPKKARIINELPNIYIPNHMPIQAKKDLPLLLAKLNVDTQVIWKLNNKTIHLYT